MLPLPSLSAAPSTCTPVPITAHATSLLMAAEHMPTGMLP